LFCSFEGGRHGAGARKAASIANRRRGRLAETVKRRYSVGMKSRPLASFRERQENQDAVWQLVGNAVYYQPYAG
jgi:hypothetical protein